MAYDYGYGELENKMIDLLRSGTPNLVAAEELIQLGANINSICRKANDENILSEILMGYWWSSAGDFNEDACDSCDETHCDDCIHNRNMNPDLGPSMCSVIRFFLEHGFDVNKCDGCFGAQCLYSLAFSTFDRYMIDAAKLLFDAGAKNRTTFPTASDDEDVTPWSFIATEGSYRRTCDHAHDTANIFEAVSQLFQAIEDGRSYQGIDSYETAVGKKILKVLAERDGDKPTFFPINQPEFKKDQCFTQNLYFVYDGGALITTQHADFWTDTILPSVNLIDVSDKFEGIVGTTIKEITFAHRDVAKASAHYGQPITTIEMDSGHKVRFSINFGEVKKEYRAAFFELQK